MHAPNLPRPKTEIDSMGFTFADQQAKIIAKRTGNSSLETKKRWAKQSSAHPENGTN
jgi:hypothetical protein